VITFAFEHENPKIDTTLNMVRDRIFEEPKFEIITYYRTRRDRYSDNCYIVIMSQKIIQQKKTHAISRSQKLKEKEK
jgi:hypothetical protein